MTSRLSRYFLVAVFLPLSLHAQERYGFVTLLGRDTVAVERVTQSASSLVSDQVERFPRVTLRHTEILFTPDRTVRQVTMNIILPTAKTARWRERQLTIEHLRDSLRITERSGEGTKTIMVAKQGNTMLPWVPHMYSLTELYFVSGLPKGSDSVQVQHYYPDMSVDQYPLPAGLRPAGFVRRLPDGRAEVFRHDALAGAGEATFDAKQRMLSYSGARSTFKVSVTRVAKLPDVETIGKQFSEIERAAGSVIALSVRDTVRASIGGTTFLVDYGRPLARGRTLVGDVLPYNQVWRTGANAATQFTTSTPITVAGLDLAPGTYTLWTLPSSNGVELIVNKQFKQWGTQYDATKDLGRVPLTVTTLSTPVEQFTISIAASDQRSGQLILEWGSFRWSAPVVMK